MLMSNVGEKQFIKNLLTTLVPSSEFVNGFGSDASLIDVGLEKLISLKIDRAATPTASKRNWCDYKLWGRIAVTSNCSDILASGGQPYGVMLAVTVPPNFEAQRVMDIIHGADEECRINNVSYLGGDTKEAREANIVGCAVGLNDKDFCLNRNNIEADDLIVIAGKLGGFLGAYISTIEREKSQGNTNGCADYIQYMAYPKAKWDESKFIREHKLATAGMDLSDGLFDALSTMTHGVYGAEIEIDKLPFHNFARESSDRFSVNLTNFAFTTGDWGIVFSVPIERQGEINLAIESGLNLSVIGRWTDSKKIIALDKLGNKYSVSGIVNEHFVSRMEDEGNHIELAKNNVSLKPI